MFSTYFTEQFPAILREIGANYKPDAIYTNGWPCVDAFEVCHCVSCQKIYEAIGGVPPETTDSRSVMYRRYYKVYMERIAEVWKLWTGIAEAANPDSTYVGNFGERPGATHMDVRAAEETCEVGGGEQTDYEYSCGGCL